jgi:hypothetical protein
MKLLLALAIVVYILNIGIQIIIAREEGDFFKRSSAILGWLCATIMALILLLHIL